MQETGDRRQNAGCGKHGHVVQVCSISSGGLDHKWACRILGGGCPSHDASALAFTCGEGGRRVTTLLGDEAKKNPVETGWNVGGRGRALGHRATSPRRAGLTARLGRERPLQAACLRSRQSRVTPHYLPRQCRLRVPGNMATLFKSVASVPATFLWDSQRMARGCGREGFVAGRQSRRGWEEPVEHAKWWSARPSVLAPGRQAGFFGAASRVERKEFPRHLQGRKSHIDPFPRTPTYTISASASALSADLSYSSQSGEGGTLAPLMQPWKTPKSAWSTSSSSSSSASRHAGSVCTTSGPLRHACRWPKSC